MENFQPYMVIVGIENIDGVDTPIIEEQFLSPIDYILDYEWADEDHTILKKKGSDI